MPLPPTRVTSGTVDINPRTRAESWITFGSPLVAPSPQSLIPVVSRHGQVFGFIPISPVVTFATGMTSQAQELEGQSLTVTTVTLPTIGITGKSSSVPQTRDLSQYPTSDLRGQQALEWAALTEGNTADQLRVQQYVALVLSDEEVQASELENGYIGPLSKKLGIDLSNLTTYKQFSTMIRAADPRDLGYTTFWSAPVMYIVHRFIRGAYLEAMRVGYDITPPAGPVPPVPPNPPPLTLEWEADLDPNVNEECSFFDFNWIAAFGQGLAQLKAEGLAVGSITPVSITVASNPTTPTPGAFKATILMSSGINYYPGGATNYDTIRILRLKDGAPGAYVFTFTIGYAYADSNQQAGSTVTATLTLNVVAPQ